MSPITDTVSGDNNDDILLFAEGACVCGVVGVVGVSSIGSKSEGGKDGDASAMGVWGGRLLS